MHSGASTNKILEIYKDVCKLAVLSGLEIDKAKRAYDSVNVGKELSAGVVKWDKCTRFFHGDMVQSSYQLLNTLGLNKVQAEELLQPSFDYISLIRNDVEFMKYHFSDAYVREEDREERKVADGLAGRPTLFFVY